MGWLYATIEWKLLLLGHQEIFEHLVSYWWCSLGRFKWCRLAGRNISLGAEFVVSDPSSSLSVLCLYWRFRHLNSCSFHTHCCAFLPWKILIILEASAKINSFFFHKLLSLRYFYHSKKKEINLCSDLWRGTITGSSWSFMIQVSFDCWRDWS